MNKIFLSCLAAAAALPAFAGIENLNYQAVLRQNDQVLSNKQVELKFYFEQNGQTIYTEDATVTTDEQGLVKWLIGTNESLNGINWNSSDINLKVSVNTGDGFTLITDGAIASVPTALYALRTAATDELEAKIDENYDDLKGSMERVEGDIRNLQGGLDEVGNEIANILQGGYDEKFLEIGADIDRLTGTQEDLVAFVEMANDEFTRLKAQEEENADFFQRASDELSRLGEEAAKIDENYDELKGYTTRNEQAISVLQGQTTELNEAVEGLVQAGYDEKFLEVVADIERLTGTQDDLVAFTEMANDEFTRLKAQEEENADFFQRVSDELSRLGEEAAKIDDNYDELKGYTTRNEQAISVLQGQTTELNEAVEGLVQAGYDEKFLEVVADIERLTGTQDDLVAFVEMANDEFTRLKAQEEENADFFQRASDELSRLGEEAAKIDENYDELKGYITRNEQAISVLQGQTTELNEAVEGILQADYDEKFLQLTADIVRIDEFINTSDDFQQRVSDELSRLGEEAAKIDDNYDELKGYTTRNEQAISVLQGQTTELNEAVEEILKADYDEKFLNMNADIERLTSTQDDLSAWVEMANDELAKLQGLDATEIDDFHQRVSDELSRLGEEAAKVDDNYDELKGYITRNEQAISVLQGQTAELNEAVEEILKADYDEKFLNMNADIERLTSTQDDLAAWVETANDELSKLQGLDATEIDDFHQRVSDELARINEANEEQTNFNQSVSDALQKLVGLDADEIGDFNTRISAEVARLADEIEKIQEEIAKLQATQAQPAK